MKLEENVFKEERGEGVGEKGKGRATKCEKCKRCHFFPPYFSPCSSARLRFPHIPDFSEKKYLFRISQDPSSARDDLNTFLSLHAPFEAEAAAETEVEREDNTNARMTNKADDQQEKEGGGEMRTKKDSQVNISHILTL